MSRIAGIVWFIATRVAVVIILVEVYHETGVITALTVAGLGFGVWQATGLGLLNAQQLHRSGTTRATKNSGDQNK